MFWLGRKDFEGLVKLLQQTYPKKVGVPIVRRAVRSGTAVLRNYVKTAVPVDEGLLSKTLGYKVTNRGYSARGMVGSDVNKLQEQHANELASGTRTGQPKNRRPTNVDWLANYGHVTPQGVFVPGRQYMRAGASAGMGPAMAKATAVLKDGIESIRQ